MSPYETLVRPLLFRLDPEFVHEVGLGLIAAGVVRAPVFEHPSLPRTVMGLEFKNPLGLAAGFDKNGVATHQWPHLGFGFAEIGTVTYHAQPGNPRPRLFRLPEDRAIINRMGFNNEGAAMVANRLALAGKPDYPLGINLGKSKITELGKAPEDYRASFELLHPHGDYFVVNVSSPNTPGLRKLQDRSHLEAILTAMSEVTREKPILIKVAPDLELGALDDVLAVALEHGAAGLIATNTTLSRHGLRDDPHEAGGLSGAPLQKRADAVLAHLARHKGKLALIGVGGVFTGDDLRRKLDLGADLVQLYTGFAYRGPATAAAVLREVGSAPTR